MSFNTVRPPDAAANGKSFLPLKTGAYCAIKKCVFKIGTKSISSIKDFSFYQTVQNSGLTAEESAGRNMPHTGITVYSRKIVETKKSGTTSNN